MSAPKKPDNNLARITERATQRPFRPFSIETIGGSWIDVNTEADILVRGQRIVIFDKNSRMYILGPEQISAIEGR
jgi:hypothetical protein